MLPKRTCPSCNKRTIKFISMFKNLYITNEGSKCSNCGSTIIVKQVYKQVIKYFIDILQIILFFLNIIYLYIPFTEFMNETLLRGTLFLVFINLIFIFTPNIIITLIYCYTMPIINGTSEELKKKNKIALIGYIFEIMIIVGIIFWVLSR